MQCSAFLLPTVCAPKECPLWWFISGCTTGDLVLQGEEMRNWLSMEHVWDDRQGCRQSRIRTQSVQEVIKVGVRFNLKHFKASFHYMIFIFCCTGWRLQIPRWMTRDFTTFTTESRASHCSVSYHLSIRLQHVISRFLARDSFWRVGYREVSTPSEFS